jgi:hypothetical protein
MSVEAQLLDLERRLDPAAPERCAGVRVLGYGEVSAVLGDAALPGLVLKRMSGFPDRDEAEHYAAVVERYVGFLRQLEVAVLPTDIVPLAPAAARHVVYLVQPQLEAERLGNALLRARPLDDVLPLLEGVLETVRRVLDANPARDDGREVAIDAQLSNWHWPEGSDPRRAVLLDVGTPFMRLGGVLETGTDLFLRAYPAPMRWWMRRDHSIEKYIADYFHFDRTALDVLGNFIKEGVPEKLPAAASFVAAWIARQADASRLGNVDAAKARAYYARDAASLELSLRVRRLARFVRTSLLRSRYDFVLPGPISR